MVGNAFQHFFRTIFDSSASELWRQFTNNNFLCISVTYENVCNCTCVQKLQKHLTCLNKFFNTYLFAKKRSSDLYTRRASLQVIKVTSYYQYVTLYTYMRIIFIAVIFNQASAFFLVVIFLICSPSAFKRCTTFEKNNWQAYFRTLHHAVLSWSHSKYTCTFKAV